MCTVSESIKHARSNALNYVDYFIHSERRSFFFVVLAVTQEYGTFPGSGEESPVFPLEYEVNVEREILHGRWAMCVPATPV